MKKKLLLTVTAFVCAVICAIGFAACGDKESVKLSYELSADGNFYTVTKIKTSEKVDVEIPSEHDGKPVKKIADSAASGKIARLTVPNTVNYIGEKAFYGSDVESVTFGDYANAELTTCDSKIQPYSLYVGDKAFIQCKLTKITIPANAYLGSAVFQSEGITEVKFEGNVSVTTDGNYELTAFRYCPLTSIILPEATANYSVGLSGLANTSPYPFDEKTFTLPLKFVVVPSCVKLTGNWARAQINNGDIYPPEIYCKATAAMADATPFYSSIKDILRTNCSQNGKPVKEFGQFVFYYSETKPASGDGWRFVNGVPAKW